MTHCSDSADECASPHKCQQLAVALWPIDCKRESAVAIVYIGGEAHPFTNALQQNQPNRVMTCLDRLDW